MDAPADVLNDNIKQFAVSNDFLDKDDPINEYFVKSYIIPEFQVQRNPINHLSNENFTN